MQQRPLEVAQMLAEFATWMNYDEYVR